jgi:S1-C subfamily serine protease
MQGYAIGVVREKNPTYPEVKMKMHTQKITSFLVLMAIVLSACAAQPNIQTNVTSKSPGFLAKLVSQAEKASPVAAQTTPQPTAVVPQLYDTGSLLAAYEGTLENVYTQVGPSVVNIRVVQQQSGASLDQNQFPFGFNNPQGSTPQYSEGLGSGFVWDTQGHIVTNNHVVEGASKIEVTFADGTTLPATLVGADSYSDLAVIKVEGAADLLHPVQMADSTQVKVGELAIAIGNPFGLEGTMTVGIVSALGRTLPAGSTSSTGQAYSIPDIIQTDAPINPGNSGGVLVDDQGRVMGVTAAIESSVNSNAGIGFAIPSAIVGKVVPSLIETGHYEHPYLGISGGNLTPDMVKAMNLPVGQRGVLVVTVADGGPAAKAGLKPSQDTTTVDGQDIPIGGDVITAINGQPITKMDDLIAFLNDETEVGQTVTLSLLRNGKETNLDVTLVARPASTPTPEVTQNPTSPSKPKSETRSSVWLGILGAELTPEIAKAMNLDASQAGILVVQVESGSPADQAKLHASDQSITINGQTVMVGGDVITSVDGKAVTNLDELRSVIRTYQPGAEVKLTVLRNGSSTEVTVTLAERPSQLP